MRERESEVKADGQTEGGRGFGLRREEAAIRNPFSRALQEVLIVW